MAQGKEGLSGAWDFADAQICPDDADYLDLEQGIPHLKGAPCAVHKIADITTWQTAAAPAYELTPAE